MLKACSVLFSVTPKKSIMNIIFCWNNMELNHILFFSAAVVAVTVVVLGFVN